MDEVLMSLFNPRGDGTLCPGDLMYDIMHGKDLVFAQNDGQGWRVTNAR